MDGDRANDIGEQAADAQENGGKKSGLKLPFGKKGRESKEPKENGISTGASDENRGLAASEPADGEKKAGPLKKLFAGKKPKDKAEKKGKAPAAAPGGDDYEPERANIEDDESVSAGRAKKAKKPKPPPKPKPAPKPKPPPKPKPAPKPKPPPKPKPAPKYKTKPAEVSDKKENSAQMDETDINIKQKAEKKEKKPREKHGTGRLGAVLYTALVFFVLLGVFTVFVVYDVFDLRGPVLLFLNPEELTREEYYASEYEMLNTWEKDLNQQELDLEARQLELDDFEATLNDFQAELDERESEIDTREEELGLNNPNASAQTYDITNIAKMLQNMKPAAAANLIMNMSDTDSAVRVMRLCKPATLGPIFEAMSEIDVELAANFMEDLGNTEE